MKKIFFSLLFLLLIQIASMAQWSNNSLSNTPVVKAGDEQTTPKIATCDTGYTYISWFSIENGNYNVRLQRFEVHGIKQWDPTGLLISANPSMTWITDYTLVTDKQNNAILSFQDFRSGYNNVYAYRIAPDGTEVWGDNGIALSNGNYFEPYARIAVPQDNQAVFVWQRAFNSGTQMDALMLQKISPSGTLLWGASGKTLQNSGLNYDWPDIVPSDSNSVILVWTKAVSGLTAPRYIYAQRIDSLGNTMWASDVPVNNTAGLPMGTTFSLISDGSGGAFIGWFDDRTANHFRAFVQHIDKYGHVSMPANGANLSTSATTQQLYPNLAWLPEYNSLLCFYQEEDMNQNNSGLFGQRLNLNGQVFWGASGKSFIPLSGKDLQFINARSADSSVLVAYMDETTIAGTLWAMRLDTAGAYLWATQTVAMSSILTNKSYLAVGRYSNGQMIATWEDHRGSDPGDIYGQNIKLNGTLGPVAVGIDENPGDPAVPLSIGSLYPNPVKQKAIINFTLGIRQHVTIQILDINGAMCKTLLDQDMRPDTYQTTWDGTNAGGNRMAPGVYLLRISCDSEVQTKKLVLQ